jgi:hypothetical protein
MSRLTQKFEELVGFTKSSEPEVRFWAVDRLVRHFPADCCDAIAELLLDDHEATPALVARHLGEFGGPSHHAVLVRGFRLLRGLTPGFCLQALVRRRDARAVELASDALKRGDLTEPALAIIVEALADLGSDEAQEIIREYVERKVEILIEPAALRGVLQVVRAEEIPDTLGQVLQALRWRGIHRAGEAFRTLMDTLQVDDAGWCFRTGPSGHIELRKTIKAVESGYDCDVLSVMGEATIKQLAKRFRAGELADVIRDLADWTCDAATRMPRPPGSDLPERIAAAVTAFSSPAVFEEIDRMGHQFQQWMLGFQLSAAFAVARRQTEGSTLAQAQGDLEALLRLSALETASHLSDLPAAIASACQGRVDRARRAEEWCLRMLEAQGPFFPKVVALETLGELRAFHFADEVMDYLTEENSYVYGAAERALSKMGESVIAPAVARIEAGALDPEAAHSILVILCDLGTQAAYEAVVRHLDWFMESVGPGTTAEWVGLFGSDELIDPLRDWLDEDPAMVGQSLLLLGAIHNIQIPEEDEILRAIEDERARQAATDGEPIEGGKQGDYVM